MCIGSLNLLPPPDQFVQPYVLICMQIEQVVIEFVASEDRLLMSVHMNGPSARIWLTRCYVRLLQAALAEVLGEVLNAVQPLAVGSNILLAELVHEQVISELDLTTPPILKHIDLSHQSESPREIASSAADSMNKMDSWLAFELRVIWDENANFSRKATAISIFPQNGEGITLQFDEKFPHAFAEMLARACEAAQWDLDFEPLGANAKSSPLHSKSSQLH